MRPGPAPTPTAVLQMRGSKRAKQRKQEPQAPAASARHPAPEHLDEGAKKLWPKMVKLALEMKTLTTADLALLAVFCSAYSRMIEAEKKVQEKGLMVSAPSGYPIQNPYLAILNKAAEQVHKLSQEFGFSPSSRSRLRLPDEKEPEDPMEKFLARSAAAHGSAGHLKIAQ